ncbi:DUF3011 domain-containing protein [Luteibacter flocculans]|uniref:DUF3011 domain-containing protein n=1 Tax=Luteibacter flocculans TaxID=2780091 RepID=A0ABY4T492_9GAMM|nr:DUF3011 domain-containing protein [Luteibacter flocculans]URL59089.1 DUF3011 domain-containing protein [Luteibacter flocculans]
MRRILGLFATVAIGALSLAAPHVAHAQRGGDTVNCYSDNGRRSYCRVPWRDARLIRQDSQTACIRGRTWDIDRGGLWVDDGCRGIFQEARGWGGDDRPGWGGRPDDDRPGWGGGRPGYGGGGQIVSCDSEDNKRVFCRWPIGRGARLVEQTSKANCSEGYSYGFTRDGIWADRGCRGKFDIGR